MSIIAGTDRKNLLKLLCFIPRRTENKIYKLLSKYCVFAVVDTWQSPKIMPFIYWLKANLLCTLIILVLVLKTILSVSAQ